MDNFTPHSLASPEEIQAYAKLRDLNKRSPIPDSEVLANLGLFLVRASFVRMQFIHNLYLKALKTHGVIMEFGVRWGQNLSLFTTFRNIHEPYNTSRKIVGFDTFEGFPSVSSQDGSANDVRVGAYPVSAGYETYLEELLSAQEHLGPRSHIKKHEIVKGDVMKTLPKYLEDHPETIIALAYFDLDLYEPTWKCLELIKPHLVKNSVVGFDELASEFFPGETQALREGWGLGDLALIREPSTHQQSYLIVGGQGLIEYAVLIAFIAILVISGALLLGHTINNMLTMASDELVGGRR